MTTRSPLTSLFGVTAVFATVVAFAVPAQAQQRLSLAERMQRLEDQQAAAGRSGQGSVELVNQIQALQSQVQELQGQIEVLGHQLGEAQRRSRDQYVDLDSRIGRLEGGGAPVAPASLGVRDEAIQDIQLGMPASGGLTPEDAALAQPSTISTLDPSTGGASMTDVPSDPASEQRAYDEAFSALKDGRYAESARRFQSFIDQYPDGALTANAYYWLGESYYVTQNYRVALDTFSTLLTRFPASQKVPDAQLKTGYCQYELKQWDAAERTLNDVVAQYPDTTVARLAQGRLRALRLETRR